LYESIYYSEIIVKYAGGIQLDDLGHSILVHAANYDERNQDFIKKNFGEEGLVKAFEIGEKLRNIVK